MQTMQVLAPAKINLSLKILGDRGDGFHEIETLITPISLSDELRIKKSDSEKGIEFRCDDPTVPMGADNLVLRAAKAFFTTTRLEPAVSIELKKKIPHGAGLGGGSSDAATTLLALNQLFETNLARDQLASLDRQLDRTFHFSSSNRPRSVAGEESWSRQRNCRRDCRSCC